MYNIFYPDEPVHLIGMEIDGFGGNDTGFVWVRYPNLDPYSTVKEHLSAFRFSDYWGLPFITEHCFRFLKDTDAHNSDTVFLFPEIRGEDKSPTYDIPATAQAHPFNRLFRNSEI